MRGQYTLVQTVLFISTIALVAGSYYLSLRRPIVVLPCSMLALLSLAILTAFAINEPTGRWFWAGALYAGMYASFISLSCVMFARATSRARLLDLLGKEP